MPDAVNFDKAKEVWTLPWDADWVTAVAFLGGSRHVAAGNQQGTILAWALPEKPTDPAPLPTLRLDGHTNCVSRLLSSADDRWLISASYDHTVRFWDMQSSPTASESVALNAVTIADLKRRSASKVPASLEAKVGIVKSPRAFEQHKEWVTGLCPSPDGKRFLSGDDGGNVLHWEGDSGKVLHRWKTKGWSYGLALSPDEKQAAVGERVPLVFDSGRVTAFKLWDVTKGEVALDLSKDFKDAHIAAAAYRPDGKVLALGRGGEVDGQGGKVFLLDPTTGKKLHELAPGHTYGVTDLVFHPDGKTLGSAGRDTMVRLWDTTTGKLVKELGKPRGGQFKDWLHALSFSADGKWVAAADMAGAVQVWHFTSE